MATATIKKPRSEAQAQLAELPERVGVVETKVESIKEQLTELKSDVKDMHECLDQTRDRVLSELDKMQDEYRTNSQKFFDHADKLHAEDVETHNKLGDRIADLEKAKSKWTLYIMVGLAFAAGTGWLNATSFPHVLKFLGL